MRWSEKNVKPEWTRKLVVMHGMFQNETYSSDTNDAEGGGGSWIQGDVCRVTDYVKDAADDDKKRVENNPGLGESP